MILVILGKSPLVYNFYINYHLISFDFYTQGNWYHVSKYDLILRTNWLIDVICKKWGDEKFETSCKKWVFSKSFNLHYCKHFMPMFMNISVYGFRKWLQIMQCDWIRENSFSKVSRLPSCIVQSVLLILLVLLVLKWLAFISSTIMKTKNFNLWKYFTLPNLEDTVKSHPCLSN